MNIQLFSIVGTCKCTCTKFSALRYDSNEIVLSGNYHSSFGHTRVDCTYEPSNFQLNIDKNRFHSFMHHHHKSYDVEIEN